VVEHFPALSFTFVFWRFLFYDIGAPLKVGYQISQRSPPFRSGDHTNPSLKSTHFLVWLKLFGSSLKTSACSSSYKVNLKG
jgi:hypothetical protein